jgi:hypothetical protein
MAYFKNVAMNKLIDLVRTAISQISSTDTDHAQVTAEALVDLNARLEALENAEAEDYGNIVAESIDLVEFPMIAGASTVLFGSSAPASAPDFACQIYIDTTNNVLYIARGNSATTDWKAVLMDSARTTTIAAASSASDAKVPTEKAARTELDKKADKKVPAATGNIATLDANGNLADGGKKISDLVLDSDLTDWDVASLKTLWDNAPDTPIIPT